VDRCLLLFTKPARPGRVKTRLIGDLTAEQAADLHGALLADALAELGGGAYDLHLAWALEEGESPPALALPAKEQRGADLGERLYRALAEAGRRYPLVAAVGSDAPTLSRSRVEAAFDLVAAGCDLALGPAEDGGYYLVAARADRLAPELFADIPWSTGAVLERTLDRGRRLGLNCRLLPTARDVDTPADLAALIALLDGGGANCPRTRSLLAAWGRLSAEPG
jgi:rSAM/selenodomain-associated transferase 1